MRPLDPRLLPHLSPARRALGFVIAGRVLAGVLVVAQAFALAGLVVGVVSGGSWTTAAVVLVTITLLRALAGWLVDVEAARAGGQVGTALRHTVVRRALDLDATDLSTHRTGELAVLATRGIAATEPYFTRYLPALVVAAVLPPLTVLAMLSQDWVSALIVLLTLPLVPLFAVLIGITTRERADRQWAALQQLSGHFVDVVRGLPTLVAFRRASAQAPRIRAITDRYRRANNEVLRVAFASSAALELVATLSVALVAVVTGLRLSAGGLDLQTALVVLLLAPEAYWPLRRVGAEFHAAAEATATFEAVDALTSTALPTRGSGTVPSAPAAIRLERVSLTWSGRTQPAIRDLDATVPARGLTVLAGPSGSGKSTVLAALLGELPVSAGRLTVDGAELTALDPEAWRTRVAYLPQRPWLLDGTVLDNVRVGRPDASLDEIRMALAACGLGSVPAATVLGEDGTGLSAGQRARLAMARVLVSRRPCVVLDEPTAHLDAETEQVLLDVVRDLARDRCVIAVAHSPALIAAADHVIELSAPDPVRPALTVALGSTPRSAAPPDLEDTTPTRAGLRLAGATALGVLASTAGVALTATAGWLITRASEHPPVMLLLVAIVGVRTFGLARPVLRYAERLVSHDVALRLLAVRRAQVFDLVVPLVPGRLGRHRGDLLASLVDDVDAQLDEQLRVRMPVLVWLGTTALTGLALLVFLPSAALLVTVGSLLAGGLAWLTAHHGAERREGTGVAARAEVSRRVLAALTDARPLVQWQLDDAALAGIDRSSRDQASAATSASRWLAAAHAWPVLAAAAGVVAMAHLAGGAVPPPVAALLVLVPLALAEVVTPVADAGSLRVVTRAATRRVEALAHATPAVVDPVDPVDPAPAPTGDRVVLDEVSATWGRGLALQHASLDLVPGRAIGVVGPSGCGKSTLAAVLVRFLTPLHGRHEVDGVPVDNLLADDVRRVVGLLDDDPYLFASSVAENVRLARPDADDDAVEGALRQAHLGAWLDSLPDGLATRIGDGAGSVSGGERARLGLARVLLADQPVLVLDEPTAHLDAGTAHAVADDLLRLRGDRALVWITHGTAGLDQMDEVLDLGRGVRRELVAPKAG